MRYRTLGRTGVQVSVLGLGGNTFGNPVNERETARIVDHALSLGVNFIDTAESYSEGASEEFLGQALAGRRDEVILATKTGWTAPGLEAGGRLTRKRIVAMLDSSLKRLRTDYVDVYYFHRPDPLTPIEESLRVMDDLVQAGKVRYAACSNYSAWQVAEMVAICDRRSYAVPAASQVSFNLLDRAAENEMVPACAHFGLSIVPHSPLAGGFLTGKYRPGAASPPGSRLARNERARNLRLTAENFDRLQRYESIAATHGHSVADLALSWLAAHSTVCSIIAGVTSSQQVDENVRATEWTLSADQLRELE